MKERDSETRVLKYFENLVNKKPLKYLGRIK